MKHPTKFRLLKILYDWETLGPEFLRRQPRALGQRCEFGPDQAWMDGRRFGKSRKPAIDARNHVFPTDQLCKAHDPISHDLWVLDVIGCGVDHAGNHNLAFRQLHGLENMPFMLVAGIGSFERKGRGTARQHQIDDVGQRNVVIVWSRIIAQQR